MPGMPNKVRADNGDSSEKQVRAFEGDDEIPAVELLVSAHADAKALRSRHDFRPVIEYEKILQTRSSFAPEMMERMAQDNARQRYGLRKQTVEPVFESIKKWAGFTQFHVRGIKKVTVEWQILAPAYNCNRVWNVSPT